METNFLVFLLLSFKLFVPNCAGNIPLGTSIMALCPQTMQLGKNLTAQNIVGKPSFESKGPPIVASNLENRSDEKSFL